MKCSAVEQFTIIEVMKLPVKESFKIRVSLESRKGICYDLLRVVKAFMTFPRQEREQFIFLVYSKATPLVPDLQTFSLPAKSIKHSFVVYFKDSR